MRMIEYQNDMIERHKDYFDKNIRKKLNMNNEYIQKYIKEKDTTLPSEFEKFLYFCKNETININSVDKKVWEILAIGKKEELLLLNDKIHSDYNGIKISLNNNKFINLLNNIFGYTNFISCQNGIYGFLKRTAMINKLKKRYCSALQREMTELLINDFQLHKHEICMKLNHSIINETKYKEALMKLNYIYYSNETVRDSKILSPHWDAYIFVMMSGIRVCPYCNRQYITPAYSSNGKVRGDIDHILPKSKYPYFSMSLYNMVPICKGCNQSLKREKELSYNPFAESIDDYFKFTAISEGDTYRIDFNKSSTHKDKITDHINTFKLDQLYNYHQNIAYELYSKRKIYKDSYINELHRQYPFLGDRMRVVELIMGFMHDENRINDEAFAKMKRDIAIELGFFEE